jgi:A/G-specific adenine glycosylase
MAQQTRLETMLPYYSRWMQRFPNLASLAEAEEQEVLAAWEGLGYYSRARNLHKSAQTLVSQNKGKLPKDVQALKNLPGIGPYTAGAIASMAFGLDEAAVDGNAIRVLSRLFDIEELVNSTAGTHLFWAKAQQHLPKGKAADFNQALMDLGATLCSPRKPDCAACPLHVDCKSFALGNQPKRPARQTKKEMPLREFAAAAFVADQSTLVLRRSSKGLLAGMWEFPNVKLKSKSRPKAHLRKKLADDFGLLANLSEKLTVLDHSYSHFSARLSVFQASLENESSSLPSTMEHQWMPVSELHTIPMGKLDRQIAELLLDKLA